MNLGSWVWLAVGVRNRRWCCRMRIGKRWFGGRGGRSRRRRWRFGVAADEPRPGAPRKITDERIEEVVVKTLEAAPADATHWSRSSMAAQSGLSKSTIGRVSKAFGLKPHL